MKLPRAIPAGHQFPWTKTNGTAAFEFPKQRANGERNIRVGQQRKEAPALQRENFSPCEFCRVPGARNLDQRRQDVDDVERVVTEPARRRNPAWPSHNQRRSDAALVYLALEATEGRVADLCPCPAIGRIGVGAAEERGSIEPRLAVGDILFAATPVVGQEQDEGVVRPADGAQRFEHAANAEVHDFDLRGVDGHLELLERLVLRIIPRGYLFLPRSKCRVAGHDSERFHPGKTAGPHPVPTDVIAAHVACNGGRRCLKGIVRGGERKVEEERSRIRLGFPQEANGPVRNRVRHIESLRRRDVSLAILRHLAHQSGDFCLADVEVVRGSADQTEIVVESAVHGPVRPVLADMPLP